MYAIIKWGQKWVGQKEARPTRAKKWTGCGPPGPITSAAYDRWQLGNNKGALTTANGANVEICAGLQGATKKYPPEKLAIFPQSLKIFK